MLTEKQHQAFQFIKQFILLKGYAPTDAQIAEGIGIRSRGVAHRYVRALQAAGFIEVTPGRKRNIQLCDIKTQGELPIIGKIAAGAPIEALDQGDSVNLFDEFLGANTFVLQVDGDSMIGDNICDGDYIICEKVEAANSDDIIIALIDNSEATLKRLLNNHDGTITLMPSNPTMSPLLYEANRIQVQGRYLGLLRLDR